MLFLELGRDALLFKARQILNENFALQMIHLVLDANRKQPVRIDYAGDALVVERAHLDPGRASDEIKNARDRKASFLRFFFAARFENFRIDEHLQLAARIRDVDHNHPLVNIDLGRSQPDSGRRIHGVRHIPNELPYARVDPGNRGGYGVQPFVRVVQDGQQGHKSCRLSKLDAEFKPLLHVLRRHVRKAPDHKWGSRMKKAIISLVLLWAPNALYAADAGDLKANAPERYTVAPGDTLWSISGRFLKSPWRWPEVWNLNNQVANPHRIYPGDVLVLERHVVPVSDATPTSNLVAVKLEPRIRVEQRDATAIPPIPPKTIEPFLSKPLIVGENDLDSAPRIVATEEDRVALGAGNIAYAEGITEQKGGVWQIFRRGDALIDPDTGESLGYAATYLGEARVRKYGPVSTLEITRSTQEIYQGDRLLPAGGEPPSFGYLPHAPSRAVSARIISAYGGLRETGPLSIVALSKGSRDGLEPGHVLALYRDPTINRRLRKQPVFGRTGPTGSDAPVTYYSEQLTPRDGPIYPRAVPINTNDLAKLPAERYGLVMVFRSFERASFGLVMEASRPVALRDTATNP